MDWTDIHVYMFDFKKDYWLKLFLTEKVKFTAAETDPPKKFFKKINSLLF